MRLAFVKKQMIYAYCFIIGNMSGLASCGKPWWEVMFSGGLTFCIFMIVVFIFASFIKPDDQNKP